VLRTASPVAPAALGIVLLAAACAPRRPAPELPPQHSASAESLHVRLQALADSTGVPGLSVAVARQGRVVFASAVGYADVEARHAAGPHTRYRIGSLSKMLTASAAMRLVQDGRLDLDADIRHYVPEFPPKRSPVTSRELAGHLSGIRHYAGSEFISRTHFDSLAPTIAIFQADSLLFTPGTRYFYSSYGYNLLGLVIERAAHGRFLDVLHREVLAPLGLRETAPDMPDAAIDERAVPYDRTAGTVVAPAITVDLSDRWPSGGMLASVLDLVSFGSAFLAPGFLADSTLRTMTTPQRLTSGDTSLVGIGWRIGRDGRGRTIWHHAGTSLGGRALLVIWPAEGVVVAIAGNMNFQLSERTADRFAELARMP
jgi:serine beta-lactamase-like protein LACTB